MKRFLLVDDNAILAENLAEIMRDAGHEVVVTDDPEAALELVRGERFDALITDMRMPVMSGARLVHEVRRSDPGLAALVISAYSNNDDLESARREGLLAVLPKPVPLDRLLDLLGRSRRDALVALVEDDETLADNLCEALRLRGFAAVTARSVLETDRLGPVQPCAAIVDLRVPGGPHGEALRRFRARFPEVPVIAVSGFSDPPPVPTAELFAKPFDTCRLLEAVERRYAERLAS